MGRLLSVSPANPVVEVIVEERGEKAGYPFDEFSSEELLFALPSRFITSFCLARAKDVTNEDEELYSAYSGPPPAA